MEFVVRLDDFSLRAKATEEAHVMKSVKNAMIRKKNGMKANGMFMKGLVVSGD